jgi:hypothetical protein
VVTNLQTLVSVIRVFNVSCAKHWRFLHMEWRVLQQQRKRVTHATHNQGAAFDAQESMAFEVNGQSMFANNTQFEGINDNERTGLLQI